MILRAKMDVCFKKMRISVCNFLLSLEEHLVYYSNEKQFLCACFCLTIWVNKFYHSSAQMGIPCIKCVLEKLLKTNSQNSKSTQVLTLIDSLSIYCL